MVKADDANVYNRAFLDGIHVEMRVIDSTEVNTEVEFFGKKYASPNYDTCVFSP